MTAPQNDQGHDHDFRQLTGAFDRPIAPSPQFADALKKRVQEEETRMQQVQTIPTRPISHRTAREMARPLPRRRLLDRAIAAAVIIGMLASTFWYASTRISDDGPLPPEATHYAAQPLSAESTPDSAQEDATENRSGAHFDPSATHEVIHLSDSVAPLGHAALSGNILIITGAHQDSAERGLMAIDLTTGSTLWIAELQPMREFVADGSRVYGVFAETGTSNFAMRSISIETGEVLWSGPPVMDQQGLDVASPIHVMTILRPVVIDDMLYYGHPNGVISAYDAFRGELVWSTTLEQVSEELAGSPGSVAADDDAIYAVDHSNTIRKLDRFTGEEIDRFPLMDRPSSTYAVDLHLRGDVLLAIAITNAPEGTTAYADAMSTSDGAPLWSQRLGGAGPGISMTDDVVAIPRRVTRGEIEAGTDDVPRDGTFVSFLNLETGEPVSLYGPSDWATQMTSASGDVFCINQGMAITCVDTASAEPTPVTLDYAPGYESFAPILYWNDTAIILSEQDGVVLLQPVPEPQLAVSAGEMEARGGAFGQRSDRSEVNPDIPGPTQPHGLAWTTVVSDPIWSMAYGDVVAILGSSEIAVHDAANGTILWSKPTSEAFRNETYDTERDPTLLLGQRQGQSIALPWIEGETMYWATTTELVGVDLYTGEETFRTIHTVLDETTDLDGLFLPWDMAVKDGTAYVLTVPSPGSYVLHAIDLGTGETLWSHKAGAPVRDWARASTRLHQLVVTDQVVAMQVSNGENSILALDAVDGTVLWDVPSVLGTTGYNAPLSNLSAVDDQYLVLAHRSIPTGASDGTPNADQSLGIAIYNIENGDLLSTVREGTGQWIYPDQGTGACSLAVGWTSTDLYIPCTTDDRIYLFYLPLGGDIRLVGQWEATEKAHAIHYDRGAAYLGMRDSIMRIDYYGRGTSLVPLTGGEACNAGILVAGTTILCMHNDSLGTFTLQAYRPTTSATPASTLEASPISVEGGSMGGDPGSTNALDETIDLSRTFTAEPFGDGDIGATEMLVLGDDLVYVGGLLTTPQNFGIGNPTMASRDLATGEQNWGYFRIGAAFRAEHIATDDEHISATVYWQGQFVIGNGMWPVVIAAPA